MSFAPNGLIVSAPASSSGKTTITLGLLRALTRRGLSVAPAKAGPDYIDPAFHAAATGRASVNLDSWGMRPETLARQIERVSTDADLVLVEGAMGMFDGAPVAGGAGDGSTGALAALTGWPVLLVIDCTGQAQSVGAVARGFATHRPGARIAGVVLNRIASERHRRLAGDAVEAAGIPILGVLARAADLALPSRHLGLVQAQELDGLDLLLERLADRIEASLDLDRILAAACPAQPDHQAEAPLLPPLGQRIAVAQDAAFAFAYPHLLAGWRSAGAEILPFSPLADQAPDPEADAIYLPGGYPELHAGVLAAAGRFQGGLRRAAEHAWIYGECGGYMALGSGLVDAQGTRHAMAGLLEVETSFEKRKLQFGYRSAILTEDTPLGPAGTPLRGHEFHYSSVLSEGAGPALLKLAAPDGTELGPAGRRRGRVLGSFLHAIDLA